MNLKLRRTLSSFLAFVMLCSCMVVANVGSVFAADYNKAEVTISEDGKTKTWDFTNATAQTLVAGQDTVDGIVIGSTGTNTDRTRVSNGELNIRSSSSGSGTISLPVPENSTGTITITGTGEQLARLLTLEDGTTSIPMSRTPQSGSYTSDMSTDGYVTLTSNDDYKAGVIAVTLTSDHTFTNEDTTTYTLTGSCTGLTAGTTFTLSDGANTYTATVNDDGTGYTVSTTTAITAGAVLTPSLANYSVSGTVTVALTDTENVFTATPSITFTKLGLDYLADGTYDGSDIAAGLPNFDISGASGSTSGTSWKGTGDIKFMLESAAVVDIMARSGSSTSGNNAIMTVKDSSGIAQTITMPDATTGTEATLEGGQGITAEKYSLTLPAGTYTINAVSDTTTLQIASITVKYTDIPEPTGYSVSASVIDSLTNEAITNASVVYTDNSGVTHEAVYAGDIYTVNVDAGVVLTDVEITAAGYNVYTESFDTVITGETTGLTFSLSPVTMRVTVSGTVSDADGAVSGAEVNITLSTGTSTRTVTGADGTYSFGFNLTEAQLSGLTADFTVTKLGYVTNNLNDVVINETTTQDITLTKESSGSGTIYEHNFSTDGLTSETGSIFSFDFSSKEYDATSVISGGVTYSQGVSLSETDGFTITAPADGTLRIVYTAGKKLNISPDDAAGNDRATATSDNVIEFELLSGQTYTISRRDNGTLYYIGFISEGEAVAEFSLSGHVYDNSTKLPITGATVATATGLSTTTDEDGAFTIAGITASTVLNVGATGYVTANGTTTYSETKEDIEIYLNLDTNVNVQFSVTNGTANSAITVTKVSNNTDQTITSGNISFSGTAGEVFRISGKPDNVAQWATVGGGTLAFHNAGSASDRYFVYTVPSNATSATTYGVTFTAETGIADEIDTTSIGTGTSQGAIGYGDYGFGTDKANKGGNEARNVVSYQFTTPTLADYSSGFADTAQNVIDRTGSPSVANQYGILNSNADTYIRFTVSDVNHENGGTIYAYVDKSGKSFTVTDNEGNVTVESAGSRYRFAVESGQTYTIKASGGKTYIKSIRIYNPNNIFKVIAADNIGTVSDVIANYSDLATKLGLTEASSNLVVRVVGQVVLSGADAANIAAAESALSDIDVLGFNIYDKTAYDEIGATSNGFYYYPGASVSDDINIPEQLAAVEFTDTVNSGVEAIGDARAYGSQNSTNTADLYCQTFVTVDPTAHTDGLVFIPYCVKDSSVIYTMATYSSDGTGSPNFDLEY